MRIVKNLHCANCEGSALCELLTTCTVRIVKDLHSANCEGLALCEL